ncbi:phosphoenolpyruvate synthase, partial [Pseudomonas aeruginosa]
KHYGRPMDIEWAKDGDDGKLYIVQARPETVKSRASATVMERYLLKEKGTVLVEGRAIGQRIGAGPVKVINDVSEMDKVQPGDVLVSDMTDPDWEPVMKRASAIVTNRGGRTCHAAIIARELGIPAVVGCGNATQILQDGQGVTVSCAEGDTGFIFEGELGFDVRKNSVDAMPDLPFKIMMNVGNPDRAFDFAQLPNEGVGLARLEFIINRMIGVHPKALLNFAGLPADIKESVEKRIAGYPDPVGFYVEKLVEGISTLAAAFWPKKVIVRLSDFKSNEYANLIGGKLYEPEEENPMLGFRGASRYISESFRDCFELECRALKKVRNEMGLTNVEIMVPFVRTLGEASQVVELLAGNGLKRGENGLKVIMMCELPSNALLADEFLEFFDGFSIGSNDLTQLTLGLDRDSGIVAHLFDERNPAVKKLLANAIAACNKAGKYIGICGQGPSDHPDLARWLMEQGIESVSLNPDSVLDTWFFLAEGQDQA